jgi:type II secretion system protein D
MVVAVVIAAQVAVVSAQTQEQPAQRPSTQPQPARRVVPAPGQPAQSQAEQAQRLGPSKPAQQGGPPRQQPSQPPATGQADPVSEMIKKLDPEMVARLQGADVTVEVVGDQVILQGPEEAVATLELLIRGLDREWEPKVLEVVTVTERDAAEIARTVQDAIRKAKKTPNQRPEDEISITALSSNILLVAALPTEIDEVLNIIEQVDAIPDPLGKIELMTFDVQYRKAGEVAKELEKILTQVRQAAGQQKDKSKLQIIPVPANNTIMVTARETEREKIQLLIDSIDVEPKKGWGESILTVFPLLHSEADALAKVIQDLIKSESKGDKDAVQEMIQRLRIAKADAKGELTHLPPIDLQRTLRIIPDKGTNSLIIATNEENVEPIGELIRLLDGVPLAERVAIKLFPLRYADAESLGETISKMFEDSKKIPEDPDGSGKGAVPESGEGAALVYNLGVTSDVRTNTLIVAGREEQLGVVADVVAKLDQPGASVKFPLKLLALEYSDATQVGKIVTELFDQRLESAQAMGLDKGALEREKVFLSTDIRSNSMIISASEENYAEIATIAKQLDTKPGKLFDQIRIVRCDRLSASDLKTKIEELWKRKADLRREEELLEDLPIVVADERSNALIVASSVEDYEEIKRLVDVLESQPLIEDTQIFKLAFADSKVIAEIMDKLFEGMAGNSETFKAPTIIPDPRSNALLIAGSRDTMERAADVLKRLDVEAGPQTAVFKVYTLKHGSSTQLAPRMQELFDSRKEGDDTQRTPIVILADESSNSVVCSASRDDHEIITGLLTLLDKPSNIAKQFEIFPLKLAKAAKVAESLESLFKSQAEGGGGAGRVDAIAAQADERTNSIIVWASPAQMTNIAEVVARLDTSAPAVDMMVKVIQLKQALAEDFSKLLEETIVGEDAGGDDEKAVIVSFLEKDGQGREVIRKLLRQDIKIKPDPRTNSLMVMAPSDSMAMLESMIRDFDKIRPITSEIRLFPLINSDAKTMVEQLTEIFKTESQGEGITPSQPVFGSDAEGLDLASVGQELRFAADPRTNTLIAAGAPVYLTMVEDLVRYLDSQEAESRTADVYQAKFRPASEIAKAVEGFNEKEIKVLGEGDTEESIARRQDRQISVESVGEAEKGSSSLLVGTSKRGYQRTMELIENLDRPEPQVMISVLIAEVTLSDQVDLGIEIAGQDLHFSEDAVVGPNGIVQGEDFDYVTGTDLGAAGLGLGGFNFTITGEDFSFLFRALQQDSRLEVLSRPILMVRNGEEGKITIADQVPIVESSQLSDTGQTQSTIGREDVGIVLTATPHISPDGYVTIEMKQEISNLSGQNIQLTEGVSSPVFQTREVETNVTIRDGETVVIGGLIQSNESQGENKVPILGDIPLLGLLFRTNSVSNRKTELLVVLTVDVLRTDQDVHQMSVEQRDKFVLPDNIRQHPLMEGLRITPQEQALKGPDESRGTKAAPFEPSSAPSKSTTDPFGPKPRTYGPVINRTVPSKATAAPAPTYGPKIARGEQAGRS